MTNNCFNKNLVKKQYENQFAVKEYKNGFICSIGFVPGWNHKEDNCGHGVKGMDMTWAPWGDHGVITWKTYLSILYPGNIKDGSVNEKYDILSPVLAADLGYHSFTPIYDGQDPNTSCIYIRGSNCYYEGSVLKAQPILKKFVDEGPKIVWEELKKYYWDVFANK